MQIRLSDISHVVPTTDILTGSRMFGRVDQSIAMLRRAVDEQDLNRWIVMYSGGKDSTATLILAIEAARQSGKLEQLDVIFCDTGVEIPTLSKFAEDFLESISDCGVNLRKHTVRPELDDSFWVSIIGKGYPPPHRNFRWCTNRLKVKPAETVIKTVIRDHRTAILTGVRFGESDARDQRLNASCGRGGECGQGLWVEHSSRLNAVYLGPIVMWRECDVWDFLDLKAPEWGYNTKQLRPLYQGPTTRFGCWTCTVVQRDRTMEKICESDEFAHLRPMKDFRNWLIEFGRSHEHRVKRPNGVVGRLTLGARRKIFSELEKVESACGTDFLTPEARNSIFQYWVDPKLGDSYV